MLAVLSDLIVTGFTPTVEGQGRFVYLDKECQWFAVTPGSLTKQPQGGNRQPASPLAPALAAL